MPNCHVIKNGYFCSEDIRFAMITDEINGKLKTALVRKFNLVNEVQVVERIENAIMLQYDISITDTSAEEDVNYESYVYVYADPRISGRWHLYGNEFIDYKPIYIGKGRGDRYECHLKYSHNSELDNTVKELALLNIEPIIKIYNKGCMQLMAHNLENYMIARLREQGVDLCNATYQTDSESHRVKREDIILTVLNLEKAQNQLIVDALNTFKTRRDVAKALGISERTLYRKMITLDLRVDGSVYFFNDNVSHT
jgi:hypothetical protein